MTLARIRLLMMALVMLGLTACVTTTVSSFDAKKDLNKAALTYVQIGYGYFEQGANQQAKEALTKALAIDDQLPGAHMGLARVYDRELEFKLADSHFQKALRYGESTEGHFQYGVYLYNRGDYKGAYKQLNKTLEDTVSTRRAQAFEYQGIVASRLDKMDVAISSYNRALALNPLLGNSFLGLANIYFERQELSTAYRYYNGFVELVRAQHGRHNATTLWLGIQLAKVAQDKNALSSMTLQLKNQFPQSVEYQTYLRWQAEQDAA